MGSHIRTPDNPIRIFLHGLNGAIVGRTGNTIIGHVKKGFPQHAGHVDSGLIHRFNQGLQGPVGWLFPSFFCEGIGVPPFPRWGFGRFGEIGARWIVTDMLSELPGHDVCFTVDDKKILFFIHGSSSFERMLN
jgi:hypothetical protein